LKNAVFWNVVPCSSCVNYRFTQDLHGATSEKTALFIVTAVKTSNLATEALITHFRFIIIIIIIIIIITPGHKRKMG
jgi:hypothetical protein